MIPFIAALSPTARRFGTYALIALGVVLIVVGAWWTFNAWVARQRSEAVLTDRSGTNAIVSNATIAADRKAGLEKQTDEIVAERAQAEQMEAINASQHKPDGDPLDAAFDRMR